jgi:diacylglycerol kinase family enzyme
VVRNYVEKAPEGDIVRVYAVGGNGITFDCVNAVAELANVELALVPRGDGIDYLRLFGQKGYEAFRSLEAQIHAKAYPTDVIKCGCNYALNFCGVGLEAATVLKMDVIKRMLNKLGLYTATMISLLFTVSGIIECTDKKNRGDDYEVEADGERLDGAYSVINIANGPIYGNSDMMRPNCGAVPNDGQLEVLFARKARRLKILLSVLPYLRGQYKKHPDMFSHRPAKKISIKLKSDKLLEYTLDGEYFLDDKLQLEVVPGAVRIVLVNNLLYEKAPRHE